jgi:hypothetical protein
MKVSDAFALFHLRTVTGTVRNSLHPFMFTRHVQNSSTAIIASVVKETWIVLQVAAGAVQIVPCIL